MHINSENAYKNTFAHIWVGYIFYPIRKYAHKLQWKHIHQINSSMDALDANGDLFQFYA